MYNGTRLIYTNASLLFHSFITEIKCISYSIPVSMVTEAMQEQCIDSKLEMAVYFLVTSSSLCT